MAVKKWAIVLLISVVAFGCSASGKIQKEAINVREHATATIGNFENIQLEVNSEEPDLNKINEEIGEGISHQETIIASTNKISEQIPKVEDKIPFWMTLVFWGLIVAVLAFIAYYFGPVIIAGVQLVASFIPRPKAKAEAKLLMEAYNEGTDESIGSIVTYRRAKDPAVDAEWKKLKKEKEENDSPIS